MPTEYAQKNPLRQAVRNIKNLPALVFHALSRRPEEIQQKAVCGPSEDNPIILISSCINSRESGDFKYNGGVKIYNLLVKLLRKNGYQAFIVTHDGKFQPWLIEHAPHVSLETACAWKQAGIPLVFITGWAEAKAFIGLADRLYFYDCELAYTAGPHLTSLKKLMETRIQGVSTHSRTQQAWYMATFNCAVNLIPIWSDEMYWHPHAARRRAGLIGYMMESATSENEIGEIAQRCKERNVVVEFIEVAGDESTIIETMQQCDLYIGLNPGKHPLWGEGSPLSQQEAMHAGCVVVAYDVHGNREYIIPGYSGFLGPRGRPDILADYVVALMQNLELKEQIRATSVDLASRAFVASGRWGLVREFLNLKDCKCEPADTPVSVLTKLQLEKHLGAPAYIGEDEIAVFAKYASQAATTLVEIGSGYGSSALLMLRHAPPTAMIYSFDPFLPDSMSGFRVMPSQCRQNVHRALTSLSMLYAFPRWCLYVQPSFEVVRGWQRQIDFLYIDGDHNYPAVKKDFEDWLKFVKPGGVIVLHDSRREPDAPDNAFAQGWPGPTQLANELKSSGCVELIEEVFSMTVWRRTDSACRQCSVQ